MTGATDPTSRDLAIWRRVQALAAAAVADPRAACGDLAVAAKAARKARPPIQPVSRANPFIRLLKKCEQFGGETKAGRERLAPEIAALLAECAGEAPANAVRPVRARADLDN